MADQWIQGAVVGLMVAGAVLYLLRRYLPCRRKAAGGRGRARCDDCSGDGCH
ncbi:FeoB-associated Cys-rich membrane protein [Azotobacter chroococcum subsp. isscasi]|uniref:FeoB-associated Cys-rich membrane protein n=1 Tax=Azotobacter chroococcum TaxID=353 RepID=UPI00103B8290|nr:FeoB-associated Cys-rich membrane protein [Azotobacter chroococcum]TBW07002.1 FeoB-associated Cys-rich membrane protein [Azotobacter chroococcum subsp. isscasi]